MTKRARAIVDDWRTLETLWLTHGFPEQAALCGELVRFWSLPWWMRLLRQSDARAIYRRLLPLVQHASAVEQER